MRGCLLTAGIEILLYLSDSVNLEVIWIISRCRGSIMRPWSDQGSQNQCYQAWRILSVQEFKRVTEEAIAHYLSTFSDFMTEFRALLFRNSRFTSSRKEMLRGLFLHHQTWSSAKSLEYLIQRIMISVSLFFMTGDQHMTGKNQWVMLIDKLIGLIKCNITGTLHGPK